MLAQYNGEGLNETKVVWYNGTGTVRTGDLLCYDDDDTNAPVSLPAGALSTPPTSAILPRNLRGRQVVDPVTANLYAIAGVVAPESTNVVGPAWITLVVPRKGDTVLIRNAVNATKGTTIFGAGNGSRSAVSFADSTFNLPAIAVSLETKDNSGGVATTLAKFI